MKFLLIALFGLSSLALAKTTYTCASGELVKAEFETSGQDWTAALSDGKELIDADFCFASAEADDAAKQVFDQLADVDEVIVACGHIISDAGDANLFVLRKIDKRYQLETRLLELEKQSKKKGTLIGCHKN